MHGDGKRRRWQDTAMAKENGVLHAQNDYRIFENAIV
jgi:hypothetical protein